MKNLIDLNKEELIDINSGQCPMKKDQGVRYYVGYFVSWLFD